uniref:helix-turn-helix transcriptional regulator n=1 Tax=Gluconobacter thailandicus TaxID=257438 RepID=UPI0009EF0282|nr:DNA-binding protein [Gluconobacter thailandicus]
MDSMLPSRLSDDFFISRREAAIRLCVSLSTIDRYVAAGVLQRYKIGPRRTLFRLRDVEHLVRRDDVGFQAPASMPLRPDF